MPLLENSELYLGFMPGGMAALMDQAFRKIMSNFSLGTVAKVCLSIRDDAGDDHERGW